MSKLNPQDAAFFDLDDEEGWEDMPVVREDEFAGGLDEEDQKKYHYKPQDKKEGISKGGGNALGEVLDVDAFGKEWRANTAAANESEYTRLRVREEDEADEVHLRTRYLFDEDQAMTPLSQMQQTKNLLTEAQRVAYVGLCALVIKEMTDALRKLDIKDVKPAIQNLELWGLKILGRLYYHMELATPEQKMIQNLSLHGVIPEDLVPALMTTHTVANPEYDPAEAKRQQDEREEDAIAALSDDISEVTLVAEPSKSSEGTEGPSTPTTASKAAFQTTARVLDETTAAQIPGVSTTLSAADEVVTLDIRWTVLCDLFLILIADSVYDARSRVLLEQVAKRLGLGWLDVVKFEQRVTEALEIQEGVEKMEQQEIIEGNVKKSRKRRYMMMGLATLGGGLVIGLSAGLLAPVIGAGIGAALTTVGVGGTSAFLTGTAGAAIITTGGVLTGANIGGRGMARRVQSVRTFDVLPLHNNKRVNAILTVSGFMTGELDDVRLPFSVLDPVVGDVYSVLWEPEMIRETGSALKILTSEVLSQVGQTVLQATVMTALMSALQWPILLTKLGYLIDNPWNNALDRAKAAGAVLADVLIQRHLGVRPITLIGFSLGSRLIFYCLLELHRQKAFGIVQDVIILGTTVTAPQKTWYQARSVVSGRFVNCYARNDWLLNYLFRATSSGLNSIAGLRPIENVPGMENIDVTDKISGHMSYRTFMPLILDQLGFPVSADYFDEPEEPDFEGERVVIREGEEMPKKRGWFGRAKSGNGRASTGSVSRPPTAYTPPPRKSKDGDVKSPVDDELPPREVASPPPMAGSASAGPSIPKTADEAGDLGAPELPPAHAGFNISAIKAIIDNAAPSDHPPSVGGREPPPAPLDLAAAMQASSSRPQSAPPPHDEDDHTPTRERPEPTLSLRESIDEPDEHASIKLSTPMTRSLSLNDVSRADESVEDEDEGRLGETSSSSLRAGPSNGFAPPPSFGEDTAIWAPPPLPEKDSAYRSGMSFGSPFNTGASPFGASTTSFGAATSAFGAPSSSGVQLSFGDVDGDITSTATSSSDRDPWTIPTSSGATKAPPSYLSNPWG
ncbi:unnamed protein product [Peniophora sp. CBMAI 1063]|nr:unnamed protein product [Peniophora sp. CBMAI 1063]